MPAYISLAIISTLSTLLGRKFWAKMGEQNIPVVSPYYAWCARVPLPYMVPLMAASIATGAYFGRKAAEQMETLQGLTTSGAQGDTLYNGSRTPTL